MPLLWRFNLHYFSYLHLLKPREQRSLCREWITANPVGQGVGWHPYPTSLRIVNWCRAGLSASGFLESLYVQAAYLSRNVETQVYGNHLLENARALVLAGTYLQGQGEADRWRERGLAIYRRELHEQVPTDGMHYERSPMYHALMLEGLLDVLDVLPEGHPDRPRLQAVAESMRTALMSVLHPDGRLALFNDSTHDIAPPPGRLLTYAHDVLGPATAPTRSLPDAGYYIIDEEDLWMMIDGGAAGPEHLMAHAHADMFSYEISLGDERFVIDSGVYEYNAGPMRQHVRSTAAHNTVQVDRVDQIECWNAFRVARRDEPQNIRWRRCDEGAVFEGRYDGYQTLIGDDIVHKRRIAVDLEERSVRISDLVSGGGAHRVESRIHLHPSVQVERAGDHFVVSRSSHQAHIQVEKGTVRREKGWYCPRFGVRNRNCVICIGGPVSLPVQLVYRIQY